MAVHEGKYNVCLARGWLIALEDRYTMVRNPRMAYDFPSFSEADQSAKQAVEELITEGLLKQDEQYYMITQPAIG